ncbi:MAG TPA: signal peptide peptidase SppA [Geobacteraceae bacterium]
MRYFFGLMVMALGVAALNGCAYVSLPVSRTMPLEEQTVEGEGRQKLLLLDVGGVISEREKSGGLLSRSTPSLVSSIRESLLKAEKDDNVAGVIVRINSPGGTVTASDIIYHDLTLFKGRKKVPVVACITGIGTSGGYYIAAAADEIVAHPTAVTGSIGVMLMRFNVEGLMGKIGVSERTIKSGEKKDILSPFRAATPEEEKLVQTIIDRLHGRFVDVVQTRPNNKLSRLELESLADGRIFTADQALQVKLIDRTGYLDDVIDAMKKKLGLEDARVVTYYRPGSYKGSIYAEASPEAERFGTLLGLIGGGDVFGESQFMYLWSP